MMRCARGLFPAVVLVAGCAGSRAQAPVETPAAVPAVEPWEALKVGDVGVARAEFTRWRSQPAHAEEGLAGLLSVALTLGEDATARSLLTDVDPAKASPLLAVTAGEVACALRPVPPAAVALASRACALKDATELGERAADTCAWKPLLEASGALQQCRQGCSGTTTLPLSLAGNQPVVMASINGHPPAPFIVDTGASTSVLTHAFAQRVGVQALPGTESDIQSVGAKVPSSKALVTVAAGGVVVEREPVAILDLPFDTIAGILAPQAVWREFSVDMDFRAFQIVLDPALRPDASLLSVPCWQHEQRPLVMLETQGRPTRPIVLDTGAFNTTLETEYDALGAPLMRGPEGRGLGGGGAVSRVWPTSSTLAARIGTLAWDMVSPTLVEGRHQGAQPVHSVGLLGMDMMMGRRVVLDVPRRQLWFSRDAQLADWPAGSVTTYRVSMDGAPQPVVITEKLVERTADAVVMDVSYLHATGAVHFRYQMADTWRARGTWLITRAASKVWQVGPAGETTEVDPKEAMRFWQPVFMSFKSVPGTPKLSVDLAGGQSCTTVTVPAQVKDTPAELSFVDCPRDPWRTRRITLKRSADAKVLWDVERP